MQQSPVILDLGQENHVIIVTSSFMTYENLRLQNVFCPYHTKTRRYVFKFLRFQERFRKASIPWRISVDGRPDC